MRPRTALAILLAASLMAGLLFPLIPATAQKAPAEPTVVAEDPEGDWGTDDTGAAPGGNQLGQDLVEASIGMADATTINFVIKLTSLPPIGGTPEFTRYLWDFTIDGNLVQLDGKFTNYSRGVCDPNSGACPPPRDPGMRPFFLRGNCRTENSVQVCDELAIIEATFDTAEATITIPVTLEQLQAKPGSIIGIGSTESVAGFGGGQIVATVSAYFSIGNLPHDDMVMTQTFTIPGGKKPKKKSKKGGRSPAPTASPQSPSPTAT
ncbi:MAG: hypothetical protein ABR505_00955 [Actinomycetota bacterium]